MSELPTIDSANLLERENQKLRSLYLESLRRESQLELLAEALRDERDNYQRELTQVQEYRASTEENQKLPSE